MLGLALRGLKVGKGDRFNELKRGKREKWGFRTKKTGSVWKSKKVKKSIFLEPSTSNILSMQRR